MRTGIFYFWIAGQDIFLNYRITKYLINVAVFEDALDHTTAVWMHCQLQYLKTHTHTFNGPLCGTTRWAIHKSAPCSRQTTTPTPHHSSFSQAGCPSCHPTNSVKALKYLENTK